MHHRMMPRGCTIHSALHPYFITSLLESTHAPASGVCAQPNLAQLADVLR